MSKSPREVLESYFKYKLKVRGVEGVNPKYVKEKVEEIMNNKKFVKCSSPRCSEIVNSEEQSFCDKHGGVIGGI